MKRWSLVILSMVILGVSGCSFGPLVSIGGGKQQPPIVSIHEVSTEVATLEKQNEELKKANKEFAKEIERLDKDIKSLRAAVETLKQGKN